MLRSCTCPRAIRSCGIIEFHWIRSVPADRIDDCVRELLPRNSSDRGLLSIERPRRGREGGKDKPDHLEDGSRYPLCREKRSRTEGGRGDLESIRFRFWLLHRHAKREIYVVPSLVDSSRRFFLLPSFVREKEEKKKFEKGMIIIVFSLLPFFLFWLQW